MTSWRDRAACKGLDTNLFFPERGEPARDALAVCRRCPVALDCVTYALDHVIRDGVWGGMPERTRRRLRKGRPRHVQCAHCFGTYIWVPKPGVNVNRRFCSDACRNAHRQAGKRASNLRVRYGPTHAHTETDRARGAITLDALEDGVA